MEIVLIDTDHVASPTRQRWSVTYVSGNRRKTYEVEADHYEGAKAKAKAAMLADQTRDDLFRRVARAERIMRMGDAG